LLEREAGAGGTWRVNTYPGCACDIPSQWYSWSQELNPNWSAAFSTQPEIQKYWEGLFHKYKLDEITRFNSTFQRADWNAETKTYKVIFSDTLDPKQVFELDADILISAIGGFSTPLDKPPGMKGLDNFKGERFHSARWDHSVELKGKTVGIIGNGCSAAQFLPILAKDPSINIVNFSRTPSWFMPRFDSKISAAKQWVYAHVPFTQVLVRAFLVALLDSRWIIWVLSNVRVRKFAEKNAVKYIKENAPKKYHDFLVPKYPFGCKRVIVDPGYLKALNNENVELISDPIDTVTEKGIRTKNGTEHPLDVLILGTGFDVSERGLGINVFDADGKCLSEQWKEQKGPQAYLGTVVSGFPNFYVLLGPNVATGHTSAIAHIESQIHYVVEMVKAMQKYNVQAFQLRKSAEDEYNKWLHKKLDNTVWNGGCDSWYRLPNGKVVAVWPGTYSYFWWLTLKPNFSHYLQIGGRERVADIMESDKWNTIFKVLSVIVLGAVVGVTFLRK
ncbi:FAD/NAD(P)-binding domain-containing protein, partial [Cystobasidium minutum MCA 4210]|uniref:FAD/NAD(P)-binding domain-containing protein n=1 Tax=Cystobasidium minutum MCA 4210 TaxID=1397322 RepID=UPI0034CE02B8